MKYNVTFTHSSYLIPIEEKTICTNSINNQLRNYKVQQKSFIDQYANKNIRYTHTVRGSHLFQSKLLSLAIFCQNITFIYENLHCLITIVSFEIFHRSLPSFSPSTYPIKLRQTNIFHL